MSTTNATKTQQGSSDPSEKDIARMNALTKKVVYADLPDDLQRRIMEITVDAIEKYIFRPTKTTLRKDEGARKELEREVERTSMMDIAKQIKRDMDADSTLGPSWHVVYGHSFSLYVTHERFNFFQFTIDGANVAVWKHGV
mgnify:CR=1 FL=1